MKEYVNVKELLEEVDAMAKRGTLLARGEVTQEDLARDRRKFASLQFINDAIDFIADLYDLSFDEVKRAMDGEEYWCI